MRTLFLTNQFPPPALGGYERDCAAVAAGFAQRGHQVDVLTGVDGDIAEPSGISVHRDLELYIDGHELVRPPLRRTLAIERANRRAIERALARAQPDVVSVWNMGAMSQGMLSTVAAQGVPMVFVVFNDWLVWGVEQDGWMSRWRDRPWARAVAAVTGLPTTLPDLDAAGLHCVISEATRTRARTHSRWRLPRSVIVPSGIEDLFLRDPVVPPSPWRGRLLYVGRLDREKGLDTAVRALAMLPEATLEVVGGGDGAVQAEMSAIALDLGIADRLRWVGPLERRELPARYAEADVLVFPSRWEEPFGLVPLEAMACGTPVVATGVGGSAEYLQHDANALLFARDDPGALAAQVERLAGDGALRARLAGAGRATAARYPLRALVARLEELHRAEVDRLVTDS